MIIEIRRYVNIYIYILKKSQNTEIISFPLNWEYLWVGFYAGKKSNICRLHWSIGRDRSYIWNEVFCNLLQEQEKRMKRTWNSVHHRKWMWHVKVNTGLMHNFLSHHKNSFTRSTLSSLYLLLQFASYGQLILGTLK